MTRHTLIIKRSAELVESLLAAGAGNGSKPWVLIVEEAMHELLRADDHLRSMEQRDTGYLKPAIWKRK